MCEPDALNPWNSSFCIDAAVFYLTEADIDTVVEKICYRIIRMTTRKDAGTPYFLVLFPGGASVLLYCPARTICTALVNGDLPAALEQARLEITYLVLALIKSV